MVQRMLLSCFLFLQVGLLSGGDTIRLLFVYGSKPKAKGESKWFGGLHGGHVSLSYQGHYMSFLPQDEIHIFPKKDFSSGFYREKNGNFTFDSTHSRYLLISLSVSSRQKHLYDSVLQERLRIAPYDYAFFGMRCASAAYELLAAAEICPVVSRRKMVRKFFYPKLLRKYLLRQFKTKGMQTRYAPGRKSRKWEKD